MLDITYRTSTIINKDDLLSKAGDTITSGMVKINSLNEIVNVYAKLLCLIKPGKLKSIIILACQTSMIGC